MLRILLAACAGAVVVYLWGMLHDQSVHRLPDEEAVAQVLRDQQIKTGLYVMPAMPKPDASSGQQTPSPEQQADANERWAERHRTGPVVSIFFQERGGEPMPPSLLAAGLAIDLLAALIAAVVVSFCDGCRGYLTRAGLVGMLGIFAATVSHVSYWNWMAFPLDHTIAMTVDVVVAWVLAGLVIAAIVRPLPSPSPPQSDSLSL
jgi:hypothetical protein